MYYPDWQDVEKKVIATLISGDVVTGTLTIEDAWFDGEEEVPIFQIDCEDGKTISFAEVESWDFTEDNP